MVLTTFSQVAINTDGNSANSTSILDVSSTTKGILVPRMTSLQRIAINSPANGLLVFDTTEHNFWYYDGSSQMWRVVGNSTLLMDNDGDTKIQVEETADEDKIRFDIAGSEYFVMQAGRLEFINSGSSVFIGENAGLHDDLTNFNTFVGYQSGKGNTVGSSNVALGYQSLMNCSTNNNVSIGSEALRNTIGSNNVALGFQAGAANVSGSGNIFIGFQTGINSSSVNNKLFIDNTSSINPLIYGEFDNDIVTINGKLGLGEAPYYSLSVSSHDDLETAYFKNSNPSSDTKVVHAEFYGTGNLDATAVYGQSTPTSNTNYGYGGTFVGNYMAIKAESNPGSSTGTAYGIKATSGGSDGTRYGVYGEATGGSLRYGVYGKSANTSNSYGVYCAGNGVYTGTWSNSSDKKLKKNIQPLKGILEKLTELNPSSYEYKYDEFPSMNLAKGNQFGFIAQELEEVFPELVSTVSHPINDGKTTHFEQYKAINYIGLIPILTQAIKEQQKVMENQDESIEDLARRIKLIENKLNK